ncbi:MAG TPA: tetratricopeptide repeat protein [Thermoanaerobaculia bacterium]|nr:tetratricopeptide repeat protein [Thermoanaerobaculia bacterium]
MSGRLAVWALRLLLVALLVGVTIRGRDRLGASVLLQRAELWSMEAVRLGQAGTNILRANLGLLGRAAELDPVEPAIPLASGSVHLLLGGPAVAVDFYQQSLALEKRPETYLNLGRAELALGRQQEARASFALALKLDPLLEPQVPAPFRPSRSTLEEEAREPAADSP